jgi:hypothetical protein
MNPLPTPEEIAEHRRKTNFKAPEYIDFEAAMKEAEEETKKELQEQGLPEPEKITKADRKKMEHLKNLAETRNYFMDKYFPASDEEEPKSKESEPVKFPFQTTHEIGKEMFESFVKEEKKEPPKPHQHARPTKRTYLLDKGTKLTIQQAVARQHPSEVNHCIKRILEGLLEHEKAWLVEMKMHRDKVTDEEVGFLLDYFTTQDLHKTIVLRQTLGKARLAEIQQNVEKGIMQKE